jgi:hypothetical protein
MATEHGSSDFQANCLDEPVKRRDSGAAEFIESSHFRQWELRVAGEGGQEPGSERLIYLLEQLEEDDAKAIAFRSEFISAGPRDFLNQHFGAENWIPLPSGLSHLAHLSPPSIRRSSLSIVTVSAKPPPGGFVPEELGIALVRNEVVHDGRHHEMSKPSVFGTKRMHGKVAGPRSPPPGVIAATSS